MLINFWQEGGIVFVFRKQQQEKQQEERLSQDKAEDGAASLCHFLAAACL